MDAPIYPPAQAYVPPLVPVSEFSVDTVAVADLIRSPSIRAMLIAEIPGFERLLSYPQLQPHLSNFTLRNLAEFGAMSADALPRVDERLRTVPVSERPGL